MDEWNFYIANLEKYAGGEKGMWFSAPINIEEVKETLGLEDEQGGYIIHDYELPFYISSEEPLERINEIYYELTGVNERILLDLREVLEMFGSIDELVENVRNIYLYDDVYSLEDLAERLVEDGVYGEVPEKLRYHIDYASIAAEFESNWKYVIGSQGIWKVGE